MLNSPAETFYEDDYCELLGLTYADGSKVSYVPKIPALPQFEQLTEDAVATKVDEVYGSLQSVESGAYSFEIALANADATGNTLMLHASTYSSSISGNPGNAYEFALQAALYPDIAQCYVASPGNGGTSALSAQERKYYRKSGRLVDLPFVRALGKAMRQLGRDSLLIGGDSLGGRLGIALGAELDEGTVSHGFFNGMPGMYDHSAFKLSRAMILTEGRQNSRLNAAATIDAWQTYKHIDWVGDRGGPRISRGSARVENAAMLLTSVTALGKGPDAGDPVLRDYRAFIQKQPQSENTLLFAQRDPLYGPGSILKRAEILLHGVCIQGECTSRALVLPDMTHGFHAYFPQLYQAIKADSFGLGPTDLTE